MSQKSQQAVPKTIEEHRDYMYQTVRLQLFFLWTWLKEHSEESLSSVLRDRIDIYRKTAVNTEMLNPKTQRFGSPEWLGYESELKKLYREYKDDVQAFEDAGFEIFHSTIDERLPKDFADKSGTAGYQCGSLRYNLMEEGKIHETVGFHIANAVQPESFFADPEYLPGCFMKLMKETGEKYGSTRLATGTWLNSLPKWLELFPQEWQDNLSDENTDVKWHYGFWGQFLTARGTFNYKYGKILRETGKLPFYPRTSNCSFEAMKKHLNQS
jgi:hypothetical protein